MQKTRGMKDYVSLAMLIIGPIFIYQLLMWLIKTQDLNPIWFSLVIVYLVLVYPQRNGLNAVRDINWILDDDFDGTPAQREKSDWIIFLNDLNLKDYFVDGALWKTIIYYLMWIASFAMIISIAYVNALVVFIDLGPTFAIIMVYTMFISTAVYILTKSLIVGNLISFYSNNLVALSAVVFPLGFYVLSLVIKSYSYQMDSIRTSDAMGDED